MPGAIHDRGLYTVTSKKRARTPLHTCMCDVHAGVRIYLSHNATENEAMKTLPVEKISDFIDQIWRNLRTLKYAKNLDKFQTDPVVFSYNVAYYKRRFTNDLNK